MLVRDVEVNIKIPSIRLHSIRIYNFSFPLVIKNIAMYATGIYIEILINIRLNNMYLNSSAMFSNRKAFMDYISPPLKITQSLSFL